MDLRVLPMFTRSEVGDTWIGVRGTFC
ncbi:unnamed protein product [Linum tenue]|uniref:Uncharacterized protein n=1 Tax=Linum tenue TaxID=586396 RepID=A0AAV0GYL7_9ROSI|nr:unnamed protein product [Linum tenue]